MWRWYVDLKYHVREPCMEMYVIERAEVEAFLKDNGIRVIDVVQDGATGDWEGFRYCVTKC